MDCVSSASAANVVDWSGATEVAFEFLVETEHGAFAGAVNVASAAAT